MLLIVCKNQYSNMTPLCPQLYDWLKKLLKNSSEMAFSSIIYQTNNFLLLRFICLQTDFAIIKSVLIKIIIVAVMFELAYSIQNTFVLPVLSSFLKFYINSCFFMLYPSSK